MRTKTGVLYVCITELFLLCGAVYPYTVDQEQDDRIKKLEAKISKMDAKIAKDTQNGREDNDTRVQLLEIKLQTLEEKLKSASSPDGTGKNTPKINGILQTVLSATEDPSASAKTNATVKRARLILSGIIVPDKVKYFIQADLTGSSALPSPLLDAKIQFYYVNRTEIAIGRFCPAFTYYMPQSTAKLDFVNYPLAVTKYAMWRQVGLQTTTTMGAFDMIVGLFDGYPANTVSAGDNNTGKDLLIHPAFRMGKSASIHGYAWLGSGAGSTADETRNRYGGTVLFDKRIDKISLISAKGEYIEASDKTALGVETRSAGYFAQLGLKRGDTMEYLARYDSFDPDLNASGSAVQWVSGGVNYFLSANTAFYLNYIYKIYEQVPAPHDNDILFQVQVTF